MGNNNDRLRSYIKFLLSDEDSLERLTEALTDDLKVKLCDCSPEEVLSLQAEFRAVKSLSKKINNISITLGGTDDRYK